jgi:hypothetical protein
MPPADAQFLTKRKSNELQLIFGFNSKLSKPIFVSALSMCCIHYFVGRRVNYRSVLHAEANRDLQTVKHMYC